MGYAASKHSLGVSAVGEVRWLLGIPLKDSEIGLDLEQMIAKVDAIYPAWFNAGNA